MLLVPIFLGLASAVINAILPFLLAKKNGSARPLRTASNYSLFFVTSVAMIVAWSYAIDALHLRAGKSFWTPSGSMENISTPMITPCFAARSSKAIGRDCVAMRSVLRGTGAGEVSGWLTVRRPILRAESARH